MSDSVSGSSSESAGATADQAANSPGSTGSAAAGQAALELDCLGLRCPLPVIALARQIQNVAVGAVVRVLADDPAAANDIPAWCRMKGQEFLGSPTAHAFDVRRLS